MASTLELPAKSTRQMTDQEVRTEAMRFGVADGGDIVGLRRALSDELGRRWAEENRSSIDSMNEWIERNGLPLEKYRCW